MALFQLAIDVKETCIANIIALKARDNHAASELVQLGVLAAELRLRRRPRKEGAGQYQPASEGKAMHEMSLP